MDKTSEIRGYAHELIDRLDTDRLQALLGLLDEEFFSKEELAEIEALRGSDEWTDWRDVRDDV